MTTRSRKIQGLVTASVLLVVIAVVVGVKIGIAASNVTFPVSANPSSLTIGAGNGATINVTAGVPGAWQSTAPLPVTNSFMPSVAYDGYIYGLGGMYPIWTSPNTVLFVSTSTVVEAPINSDGSLGAWFQSSSSLPVNLDGSQNQAIAYNGSMYWIGGIAADSATSSVFEAPINADGSLGAWTTSANSLPAPYQGNATVVYNGYLYSTGGCVGCAVPTTTVLQAPINADGSLGAWVQSSSSLPFGVWNHAAVVYNGYIYTLGGQVESLSYETSTVYEAKINANGSLGPWITSPNPLPVPLYLEGAVVSNGTIYATGGVTYAGMAITNGVYSSKINADGSLSPWVTQKTSGLPVNLYAYSSVAYNGYIYIPGGSPQSGEFTSTVLYAPVNADGMLGSEGNFPVTFSINGLPAGVSTNFSSTTVNAPGTSALTFSTASTTATGTYPLVITGMNGGAISTTSVSLTIATPTAAPTITALTPSSTLVGGPAFTLTIKGTNFLPPSIAEWNGMLLATTYVSASKLTATVPSVDIVSAGTNLVTLVTGGSTSNAQIFTVVGNPDFSLVASPTSQTVKKSGQTTYTITVVPQGGFKGHVAFSVSGLPSGASAYFNPTTVAGSGSTVMTVTAGKTLGTSNPVVKALSGSLSHTVTVQLVVVKS